MARYGNDFMGGRQDRFGHETGMGYDSGYRDTEHWTGRSPGRGQAWTEYGRDAGWRGRMGIHDFDESWDSMGHGRGRPDYGEAGYGPMGWGRPGSTGGWSSPRPTSGWGTTGSSYGQYGREAGYGGMKRGMYDRDMHAYGGRVGNDYDEDFGDRIRRGWNRLRHGAREWMGRGYDRGW